MSRYKRYTDSKIWQKSMEIVEDVYKMIEYFPIRELDGLAGTVKKSAISIPSSISDGYARENDEEYIHFLYEALGLCAELKTQLALAKRLNLAEDKRIDPVFEKIDDLSRLITMSVKRL